MTPACVLLLLVLCSAWEKDANVLRLSDSDFQTAVQSLEPMLVAFSVPWCGHCRKLEPELTAVAAQLATHNPSIHLANIDAEANPKTAASFNITGFPTLIFFQKGMRMEYTGQYTAQAISQWLMHKVDTPLSILRTEDEVTAFLTANPVSVLLFDNETSEGYTEFKRVAEASEDHIFALSTIGAEKYEVNVSTVVLFKPYDDKKVVFNGTLTSSAISTFITQYRAPWVSLWNDTVISYVFDHKQPIVIVFYPYFRNIYYRAVMDDIAPYVKDDIKFAYTDLETTDGYKFAEYLGIEVSAQPTAMILDWVEGALVKYTFIAESLNKETLREFIEMWRTDQLVPYYKSEKPAEGKTGAVRKLTGKDFASALNQSESETLVLFHVPWSSQCREAVSLLEAASKQVTGPAFAKIDMNANELPEETFGALPELRLYAAGGKLLRTFVGQWSVEAVEKFAGVKAKKTEL